MTDTTEKGLSKGSACALCGIFTLPLTVLSWLLRMLARPTEWCAGTLRLAAAMLEFCRVRFFFFRPRPDDIFLCAYPRSGVTMCQMMLYQLTTDGTVAFMHISDVCPWFERAIGLRRTDLDAVRSPRVFKTHLHYSLIPKGSCRYIYIIRDGRDVAVSFHQLLRTHTGYKGSFRQFFRRFMRGWVPWGSWFKHVAGWEANASGLNVLYLRYEDIVSDKETAVKKVADFCGIEIKPEDMQRIVERCGFKFMKEHEVKFDYHTEHMLDFGRMPSAFIRSGHPGSWQTEFTDEQKRQFEEKLKKQSPGPRK